MPTLVKLELVKTLGLQWCRGLKYLNFFSALNVRENWIDTLCGDLNTGLVPQNPMGHKFIDGGTYPL